MKLHMPENIVSEGNQESAQYCWINYITWDLNDIVIELILLRRKGVGMMLIRDYEVSIFIFKPHRRVVS